MIAKKLVFTKGVNFPHGGKGDVRFEAGDVVPDDITVAVKKTLTELEAIGLTEEKAEIKEIPKPKKPE